MPHLHCCTAALYLSQQHSSLFVVFDWPIQRRTDWVISFSRVLQLKTVSHLIRQITNEGSHHKSNKNGNINQCLSDPLLLQQFVRPALPTVWAGWRIIGTVVTTVGTLY
jgi:hypothetical protein